MKIPVSHIVSNQTFQAISIDELDDAVNDKMHEKNVHQEKKEIVEKMNWLAERNIDYKIRYELDDKEVIRPAGHIIDSRDLWEDFDFYRCFVTMYFEFDTNDEAVFFKISN